MRICLYSNESAGDGSSADQLTRLIERAGHRVARVIDNDDHLATALQGPFDCVVAAGGDGTVARVGRLLAHGTMPLAILPMGTANNIAGSLGIDGEPEQVIAAWQSARVVHMDVGVVNDASGHCRFLEGVGVGLLPAGIEAGNRADIKSTGDAAESVTRARALFLETLLRLEPRHFGLTIEGTPIDEDLLLVEVLNIATVGPRIRLSVESNPADGLLSVVAASASDRDRIAAHLRGRWDDHADHAELKTWRTTRVEVRGWHQYHVDDQVRVAEGETVSIHVEPGALPVLA